VLSKRRAIVGTCLVLLLGCALDAAAAQAGTYEVAICHDPATQATAPTDGVSFATSGSYTRAGVFGGCGPSGYLYATLDGLGAHGASDFAQWYFSAPASTTIAELAAYRALSVGASAPYATPIAAIYTVTGGASAPLSVCAQYWGCSALGGGPLSEFDAGNLLTFGLLDPATGGPTAVVGNATCGGGGTCAPGSGAACPELSGDPCIASDHLYAMVVTLEDDSAPTVAQVVGSLVDGGGPLTGRADLTVDATDTGSGLYSVAMTVDGAAVTTVPFEAAAAHCTAIDAPGADGVLRFGYSLPCPLAGSSSVAFDTSALHDGTHTVSVTVSDAAGNATTAWSGTIQTDNAPHGGTPTIAGTAKSGETLVAQPGTWSPDPAGYTFQWERCDATGSACTAIAGATGADYLVTPADAYRQLAVVVTAADAAGADSASPVRSAVAADANGYTSRPPAPAVAGAALPSVTGATHQGATLATQPGTWSNGPISYAFQWQRCDRQGLGCIAIPGALSARYSLARADDYARIRVLVSASGPGGTAEAASEPTRVIADRAGSTTAPPGWDPGVSGAAQRANGAGACTHARLRITLGGGSATRADVPLGRNVTLHGALHCGAKPIGAATVQLTIAAVAGPAAARHATARTSAGGSFTYPIASGPSRRITAAYRAFAGEPAPVARSVATVLERPAITLAITPTSTVNGHTITFTGHVSGGHEPAGGLTLQLEYLEGTRWMIYDIVRARPGDGAFTYHYTFSRTTQSITYTFRVEIPAAGVSGYPYASAASPPASVHVDP
jgi:hypothetical protein